MKIKARGLYFFSRLKLDTDETKRFAQFISTREGENELFWNIRSIRSLSNRDGSRTSSRVSTNLAVSYYSIELAQTG